MKKLSEYEKRIFILWGILNKANYIINYRLPCDNKYCHNGYFFALQMYFCKFERIIGYDMSARMDEDYEPPETQDTVKLLLNHAEFIINYIAKKIEHADNYKARLQGLLGEMTKFKDVLTTMFNEANQ